MALDVEEIDSAAQSFVANLFVSVHWQESGCDGGVRKTVFAASASVDVLRTA